MIKIDPVTRTESIGQGVEIEGIGRGAEIECIGQGVEIERIGQGAEIERIIDRGVGTESTTGQGAGIERKESISIAPGAGTESAGQEAGIGAGRELVPSRGVGRGQHLLILELTHKGLVNCRCFL